MFVKIEQKFMKILQKIELQFLLFSLYFANLYWLYLNIYHADLKVAFDMMGHIYALQDEIHMKKIMVSHLGNLKYISCIGLQTFFFEIVLSPPCRKVLWRFELNNQLVFQSQCMCQFFKQFLRVFIKYETKMFDQSHQIQLVLTNMLCILSKDSHTSIK